MRPAETRRLHKTHIKSSDSQYRRRKYAAWKRLRKRQDKMRLKRSLRIEVENI